MTNENPPNQKNEYETLYQQRINASFDAGISVRVSKGKIFVNLSLALFGGKTFTVKDTKGMAVVLRPKQTQFLIEKLQEALDVHIKELADVSEEEPDGLIVDW